MLQDMLALSFYMCIEEALGAHCGMERYRSLIQMVVLGGIPFHTVNFILYDIHF